MAAKIQDMIGNRYGRLVVADIVITPPGYRNKCRCKCDCGSVVDVDSYELKRSTKSTRSCGCLYRESRKYVAKTHGLTNTRIYNIWRSMNARCARQTDTNYKKYGKEGVNVCEEWQTFEPFYEWAMANGYRDDLTIDRVDNEKGYCPDNCRWATQREQQNNRRNNRKIELNGEVHTCAEWARILNIHPSTLSYRLNVAGLNEKEALTRKVKK